MTAGGLVRFCRDNPDYYGVLFPALQGLASWRRTAAVVVKPRLQMRPASTATVPLDTDVDVVIDATHDGRHQALWMPLAIALRKAGVRVALIAFGGWRPGRLESEEFRELAALGLAHWDDTVAVARTPATHRRQRPSFADGSWRERVVVRSLCASVDRLSSGWATALEGCRGRTFVTTDPYGCAHTAFIRTVTALEWRVVYMQQGLPDGGPWQVPACAFAIVWSELGARLLRQNGWTRTDIQVARRPDLPSADRLAALRARRRAALGCGDDQRVVLFVGQVTNERGVLPVPGYREACGLLADGVRAAGVPLTVLLRPHQLDDSGETRSLLGNAGLRVAHVSTGASLWEDVAAADVVVSFHSTALEEAALAGARTIQLAPPVQTHTIDFTPLGTTVVRSAGELAAALVEDDARPLPSPPPGLHDVVRGLLAGAAAGGRA